MYSKVMRPKLSIAVPGDALPCSTRVAITGVIISDAVVTSCAYTAERQQAARVELFRDNLGTGPELEVLLSTLTACGRV
jgi:hypothetical protein